MQLLLESGAAPDAATAAGRSTGSWLGDLGQRRLLHNVKLAAQDGGRFSFPYCAVLRGVCPGKATFPGLAFCSSRPGAARVPAPCHPFAALHRAAWMGHIDVVHTLLAAGATPGLQDADGQTALHKAVQRGHSGVAAVLLAAAPELAGVQDKKGRLAADLEPG